MTMPEYQQSQPQLLPEGGLNAIGGGKDGKIPTSSVVESLLIAYWPQIRRWLKGLSK